MMEVRQTLHTDLKTLVEQGAQSYFAPTFDFETMKDICKRPYTFTGLIDGKIMVVSGLSQYWNGRAEAWSLFHPESRRHFIKIFNTIRRFFDICDIRRIEATIDCDNEFAHRWIQLLGFTLECEVMKSFLPDGKDASMYVRIKK